MKLRFKQRMFSWLDSYDICGEDGGTVFTVEGKPGWGHRLHILDCRGEHIATVKQRTFSFVSAFDLYLGETLLGTLHKEISFLRPRYSIDFNNWQIEGNFMEWDYSIADARGIPVATVRKELFQWTDTYTIDVIDPNDALYALMVVLAIDAEKCSRD